MKPLGEIVTIHKGRKAAVVCEKWQPGARRYLQIDDLRPDATIKFAIDANGVAATERDILIAWDGANAGTVGYGLNGYAGSTIAILRIKDTNMYTPFLGKFLQSKFKYLRERCTGATIPHIERTSLEELEVPFPSFDEQKRIAALLDKADRLRRTRRYIRQLSESILQSVFLEMFGDPLKNPMRWDLVLLEELGDLDRGRSKHRPRNAPHLLGGQYPLIQTGEVANSDGYIRAYTQTYSEFGRKQSKMWPRGTLCITIAANIAKTGILLFDACFPDSVVGFIANQKTNTEYVQQWFSFVQQHLERIAPESAQKNINLEILRGLQVPLPPVKLQERFAAAARSVKRVRGQQREADRQAEHLFQTLLHRAFSADPC